jgi:hypothetical protein
LSFYPKKVQANIIKRKHHDTQKVFRGITAPKGDKKGLKALAKMKELSRFQSTMIDSTLQKMDRHKEAVKVSTEATMANLKKN